ncbi:MAG: cytochrome c biogenesis protein CcdA [Alphaproteobacteria bacterium]|nr:cytochrome c biogenesis protein CcdA [Alphaproteobacteria bacterium]
MGDFDVSYAAALFAGVVSFVSPCVLPLVPAYLCFVAGTTLDKLIETDAPADPALARRVMWSALAFVLGFSTVFVALGASASALNRLLFEYLDVIAKVAGVVIVIFGLQFMGLFRIAFLNREMRLNPEAKPAGLVGAYLIGLAFAFGWTPCVGPILAAILTVAGSRESLGYGVSLLATYAIGLGLPFLLAAAGLQRFLGVMRRLRPHMRKIELVAGAFLVVTGVLVFTGSLQTVAGYLLDWFPFLATIG